MRPFARIRSMARRQLVFDAVRARAHSLALAAVSVLFCAFGAQGALVGDLWDYDPGVVGGYEEGPNRNDIVPGEFMVDPPTLENLGFRWYIEGDTNRNATVEVAFRCKGAAQWREAQPLLRVHHEIVNRYRLVRPDFPTPERRDISYYYRVGNLFAGSVFGLEPGTEYEVRFTMSDPDGGAPTEPKVVGVATRTEPETPTGGRTLRVYPADFAGEREADDVFDSIPAALAAAGPGDVVLLQAGTHKAQDAPYTMEKSGEPGRPIAIRGEGAARTILEGPDMETDLFRLPGVAHVIIEDMALRRAHSAIHTHADRAAGHPYDRGGPGASWVTVRRCRIEEVINGVWTCSENSQNWYIADNVITGIDEEWHPRQRGAYMAGSHTGVNVYGQGHVVCHNRISRFSDALCVANFGQPAPENHRKFAVNIDFHNNDLSLAMDDTIEADSGCHNIRVYRNRCANTHTALSVQPSYGGPIYLFRNIAYGITYLSYKWNNHPTGILAWHNTTVSSSTAFSTPPWSNGHLRNNLLLGNGRKISAGTLTPERSTMDRNGWRSGSPEVRWIHGNTDRPEDRDQYGRVEYPSFEAFVARTGYGKSSFEIDFDVFVDAKPAVGGTTYSPGDYDLRLRPGSKPVDAGVRLANINDDYTGDAPDLGAYEIGRPVPHYGPRGE